MKRFLTTLLAISALLLAFTQPVSAEKVSVGSTTVTAGGTATVAIQVTDITTNIEQPQSNLPLILQ